MHHSSVVRRPVPRVGSLCWLAPQPTPEVANPEQTAARFGYLGSTYLGKGLPLPSVAFQCVPLAGINSLPPNVRDKLHLVSSVLPTSVAILPTRRTDSLLLLRISIIIIRKFREIHPGGYPGLCTSPDEQHETLAVRWCGDLRTEVRALGKVLYGVILHRSRA